MKRRARLVPLGTPRHIAVEIRAAALHAGYETADDLDEAIDDPYTANVLASWLGLCDLRSEMARDVAYLAETIQGSYSTRAEPS